MTNEKSDKTTRRGFVTGLAAAGLGAAAGCRSLCGQSFYGATIRDRLWMWGHHPDMSQRSVAKGAVWPGPAVDQAEGCRLMGIPNNCVIRWGNKPAYPWGDYFEQFKSLKRISFGIADASKGSVKDKMRLAFDVLQPTMPNLTGCFLDDYFCPADIGQKGLDLRMVSDEVHAHGLRLSVVLYSDQNGFRKEYKRDLGLCDETSLWFWKSANIETMGDQVKRCREFIGPEKDLLLGLYMWDFGGRKPMSADLMARQLDAAGELLRQRIVCGLIFHCTILCDLGLPVVESARAWISEHGKDRI